MNDCKKIMIGDFMMGAAVKNRPHHNGQVCEVVNIAYVADYVGRNYVGDALLLFVRWPDGSNTLHREASGELRRPTIDELLATVITARRHTHNLLTRLACW